MDQGGITITIFWSFPVAPLQIKKCLFSPPQKLWEVVVDYRQWWKCLGRVAHEDLSWDTVKSQWSSCSLVLPDRGTQNIKVFLCIFIPVFPAAFSHMCPEPRHLYRVCSPSQKQQKHSGLKPVFKRIA